MASFIYAGVQAGKKIGGEISAPDLKAASTKLRQKKIIVTSIKRVMKILIVIKNLMH